MTRRPKVTELDEFWDQAARDHPDSDAKPFFPTKPQLPKTRAAAAESPLPGPACGSTRTFGSAIH